MNGGKALILNLAVLLAASLAAAEWRTDRVAGDIVRVSRGSDGSCLNRYGILDETCGGPKEPVYELTETDGGLRVRSLVSRAKFEVSSEARTGGGYRLAISLRDGERLYGLGDVCRTNLMRRGGIYRNWVENSVANIPIPVLLSRDGWGVFFNSTWDATTDVGATRKDRIVFTSKGGSPDLYLFFGRDLRALLEAWTRLSGRPAMLPVWGYGFTYVCNQNVNAGEMMNEAMTFRRLGLPCDVIGLEPGWMETYYDLTTRKKWHPDRFRICDWQMAGEHTFLGGLDRIGFKLSLWLCCDYDLFRYEEELLAGTAPKSNRQFAVLRPRDNPWQDERIGDPAAANRPKKDDRAKYEEGTRPWFEHLEGFVLQGARAFKLDGCNQLGENPGRKWANGRSDAEMHNVYPVVYAKQMAKGYTDFTGRRPMIYSAGGGAGVQKFVATWAGDTGGSSASLASLLNLGVSGHSNTSCDMEVNDPEALHFGFLQPWSQQANWDYWQQPWLREGDAFEVIRDYVNLRYRLLPYIYTAAWTAHRTGWPMVSPLAFHWDDPAYDKCLTTYLFGPDLLVSAFADETVIPPGTWYDWFTGEKVVGPTVRPARIDARHGGGLYVRGGAVIPTWPDRQHNEKGWNETVVFEVWPGADGECALHEDDGVTFACDRGECATLRVKWHDRARRLEVVSREGAFRGAGKTPPFRVQILTAMTRRNVIDSIPDPTRPRRLSANIHCGDRVERVELNDVKVSAK